MRNYDEAMAQVRQINGEPVDLAQLFVPDKISPRISRAILSLPVQSDPADLAKGIPIMGPEATISFSRLHQGQPALVDLSGLRSATLTYEFPEEFPGESALTVVGMAAQYCTPRGERWWGLYADPLTGPRAEAVDSHSRFKITDGLTIQGFRGVARLNMERIVVDEPRLVMALQIRKGMIQRTA